MRFTVKAQSYDAIERVGNYSEIPKGWVDGLTSGRSSGNSARMPAPERMNRHAHIFKWAAANPPETLPLVQRAAEIARKTSRDYRRERIRNDPDFRVLCNLRGRIGSALKAFGFSKHKRTRELIGCTVPELRRHLESLWTPGMGWENYGEWRIDHKRPCSSFNLREPAEQCACFHFTNLQPLWALDNFRKSDNWVAPCPQSST